MFKTALKSRNSRVLVMHSLGGALLGAISHIAVNRYFTIDYSSYAKFNDPMDAILIGAIIGGISATLLSVSIAIIISNFRSWQVLINAFVWTVMITIVFGSSAHQSGDGFSIIGWLLPIYLLIGIVPALLLTLRLLAMSVAVTEQYYLFAVKSVGITALVAVIFFVEYIFFVVLFINDFDKLFSNVSLLGAALIGLALGVLFGRIIFLWLSEIEAMENNEKQKIADRMEKTSNKKSVPPADG